MIFNSLCFRSFDLGGFDLGGFDFSCLRLCFLLTSSNKRNPTNQG